MADAFKLEETRDFMLQMIAATRDAMGKTPKQILAAMDEAARRFGRVARARFGRAGEMA